MTPLNKEAMTELASRVESANGADRELDALIHCALKGWAVAYEGMNVIAVTPDHGRVLVGWIDPGKVRRNFTMLTDSLAPAYTASLDAAMTLVPEGAVVRLIADIPGRAKAGVCHPGVIEMRTEAATPALALTAACLRALSSQVKS